MSRRVIRHEHSVLLDAPEQRVWQLASDISRYPEWVGVTLAVLDPCPKEAAAGATYRERTRLAGPITTVASWTVVHRDDVALFQRHECADEPGPVKGMWIELRVAPGARTRFTVTIGCEVTAGPLTNAVGRLFERRLGAENERNVARFAALVTAGPTSACADVSRLSTRGVTRSGAHPPTA